MLAVLLLSISITCSPTACTVTWQRDPGGVVEVSVSYQRGPGCFTRATSAASGSCTLPVLSGQEIAVTMIRDGSTSPGAWFTWERQTVRAPYRVWLPVVGRG